MNKLIMTLLIVCTALSAFAEEWSVSCENNSCVASHGGIKVYWMPNSFNDKFHGKLTGVEGLPINLTDFETCDKKMNACFVGVIPKAKENEQSQVTAGSAQIDYALAFVNWLGNCQYGQDKSIRRFWWACEEILIRNSSDNLTPSLEAFLFNKHSKRLNDLPIDTPLNDKNRQLLMTKWFTIKKLHLQSSELDTHGKAYSIINKLSSSSHVNDKNKFEELSVEYAADMEKLKVMLKPGMTAKQLAANGKWYKDLAFAKWIVDSTLEQKSAYNLADSYMISMAVTAGENKDKKLAEKFDNLLEQNDTSVNKVTVEESSVPIVPTASSGK